MSSRIPQRVGRHSRKHFYCPICWGLRLEASEHWVGSNTAGPDIGPPAGLRAPRYCDRVRRIMGAIHILIGKNAPNFLMHPFQMGRFMLQFYLYFNM